MWKTACDTSKRRWLLIGTSLRPFNSPLRASARNDEYSRRRTSRCRYAAEGCCDYEKALALDPRLAAARRLALPLTRKSGGGKRLRRATGALDLDPDDPTTHARLGTLLMWLGRTGQVKLEHARRARELDPLNVKRTIKLGWLLYHAPVKRGHW